MEIVHSVTNAKEKSDSAESQGQGVEVKNRNIRKLCTVLLLTGICVLNICGCTALDVVKDILSVNHADTKADEKPKVTINQPTQKPRDTVTPEPTETPTPEPTEEPKDWMYCISPVNVRAGAGNQEQILGFLTTGEKVEKIGEDRNWIQIIWEGREGWVYGDYLEKR